MVSFINPFTSSALTTALPDIGTAYGASEMALSWVIETFLIVSTITIMPVSKMADRWGKRRIFLIGVLLFCCSSLSVFFVSSIMALLVIRVLQGLASACIFATNMAIISLVTNPQRRGRAMGFTIAAVYSGLSFGPVLGGFFSYYLNWQAIFYFIALVCAIVYLLSLRYMKEEWIVNAVMTGLSELAVWDVGKYLLTAGLLAFGVFLYREWHTASPVLPVRIFSGNRVFSFSSLAAMLNYCATFGISFLLSIYLQRVMGMNARDTGLILLMQPVFMAVLSPVTGTLSDKISPSVLASSGMVFITAGLATLTYTVTHPLFICIIAALVIIGIGFSLFTAPNNNAIMGSVTPQYYGAASSVVGTVRLIGQVLSVAIITLILSQNQNGTVSWLTAHIQLAFLIFTILCAIGIIPSAIRNKT